MFGFGFSEVILILVIALVFIGPKKLPEVARAMGKGYAEFRKAMNDFKDAINLDDDAPKTRSRQSSTSKKLANIYREKFENQIFTAEDAEPAPAEQKTEKPEQTDSTPEAANDTDKA